MQEETKGTNWPDSSEDVESGQVRPDKMLLTLGFIGSLLYAVQRLPTILVITMWQGPITPDFYSWAYLADLLEAGSAIMIGLGLFTLAQAARRTWAMALPPVLLLLPLTSIFLSQELVLWTGGTEAYQIVSPIVFTAVWVVVAVVLWTIGPLFGGESQAKLTSLVILFHIVAIPISQALVIPFIPDISQIWLALVPAAAIALLMGVVMAFFFFAQRRNL